MVWRLDSYAQSTVHSEGIELHTLSSNRNGTIDPLQHSGVKGERPERKKKSRSLLVTGQVKRQEGRGKQHKIPLSVEIGLQWKEMRQARQKEKQEAMKSFQNSLNRDNTFTPSSRRSARVLPT